MNKVQMRHAWNIAARMIDAYGMMGEEAPPKGSIFSLICIAHVFNGGLRLEDMASADITHLFHDVTGIHKHMNWETLEVEGCFMPRFAGNQHEVRLINDLPNGLHLFVYKVPNHVVIHSATFDDLGEAIDEGNKLASEYGCSFAIV